MSSEPHANPVHAGAITSHTHPGAMTYIKLAVVLGIITLLEVATYYIHAAEYVLTLALIVLSAIKFALVVMYYMHLKFDSRFLSGVFVWGIFIAASIMIAMIALYTAF
jgi:cytochrome c oxidase subunit 4